MRSSLLPLALALTVLGCSRSNSGSSAPGGDSKQTSAKDGQSGGQSGGQTAAEKGKPDKSSQGGAQPNDVVTISPEDQARAGIQVAFVLVGRVPRSQAVAGQVVMDEQHTSHVGVLADGRIMAVNVLPGAPVHRGQVLGTLHSHTVHETVGALVQAYAAVDRQRGAVAFAAAAQTRYHHLYEIQAASLEESQRSRPGAPPGPKDARRRRGRRAYGA